MFTAGGWQDRCTWNTKQQFFVIVVGCQNMPPQYMPLWHKDYFELKTIKKQQMPKNLSASPSPLCLKAGHKFLCPASVPGDEG